ncbi:hypothetical protein RHMOL_Rhmol02G0062500 [Rhododendron molle]|uniref:Uncharacterized protein n=1 Tax=Rhododendron molle TaxID=49168 RepID=A0ACC0PPH0_RHOML|nr:hypothetical protein RHMOL_Rhmol02G0062500 [Rhododendron molle]
MISFRLAFLPSFGFHISGTGYIPLGLQLLISNNQLATALWTSSPQSFLNSFNISPSSSMIIIHTPNLNIKHKEFGNEKAQTAAFYIPRCIRCQRNMGMLKQSEDK